MRKNIVLLSFLGALIVVSFLYFLFRTKITISHNKTIYKNESFIVIEYLSKLLSPKDTNKQNKFPLGTDDLYFKDKEDNVYFYHTGGGMMPTKAYFYKIESADSASFVELSCGIKGRTGPLVNCEIGFAKDKNYVYHNGWILKEVDPHSFKFLSVNSCTLNQPCFSDVNKTYFMTKEFDYVAK